MTIRQGVQRVQLALEAVAVLSAGLWGACAALLLIIVTFAARGAAGLPGGEARGAGAAAALAGAVVFAILSWRSRFVWRFDRVALWIEERVPDLGYSVVTASEPRHAESLDEAAAPMLARAHPGSHVARAAARSILPPVAALAVAFALIVIAPASWRTGLVSTGAISRGSGAGPGLLAGSRLTPLTARIIPPAYANARTETISEPSTIAGIQGTKVYFQREGPFREIKAEIASADGRRRALPVEGGTGGWTVSVVMTDTAPSLVSFAERTLRRSVVLNSSADAAPSVKLRLPARDTVLRAAAGNLQLAADISDDVGIGSAQFEYILSTGAGETFSFRQGTLAATQLGGRKIAPLAATAPLSFFKLAEGDRLSVRAVAADLNSLTGPGRGFSETRTIRIARRDEYDSLSVEAAPPSADTAMLSLRMLIVETEKLEKERTRIARQDLVARSRVLARQTDRIQDEVLPLFKEVGADEPQVMMDTESTERAVPLTAALKTAVNALGQASRDLDIADTQSALPEMYRAYKALQSLRTFKRYYLRGATRPVIVDIQRVRLAGKTKGIASPRRARPAAPSERDRMRAEYSAAVEQIPGAPSKAVAMLVMLRVESLRKYPALSTALEAAISAIGGGGDVTVPLLKVRRILEATPALTGALPEWGSW